MAKTKDDILAVLEKLEKGEFEAITGMEDRAEYVAGFNAIIKESNKNLSNAKKLAEQGKESEEAIKSLTEKFNKVSDFIGLSLEDTASLESVEASLKKITDDRNKEAEGKEEVDKQITTLNVNLQQLRSESNGKDRLIKELTDKSVGLQKDLEKEIGKRRQMISQLAIRDALIENEAVAPEHTARIFQDAVRVREDDTVYYTDESGNEMNVTEGVRSFLEKNPVYRKNNQIAGAGGSGSAANGGNIDFDNLDPAEYRKLREEGKIR